MHGNAPGDSAMHVIGCEPAFHRCCTSPDAASTSAMPSAAAEYTSFAEDAHATDTTALRMRERCDGTQTAHSKHGSVRQRAWCGSQVCASAAPPRLRPSSTGCRRACPPERRRPEKPAARQPRRNSSRRPREGCAPLQSRSLSASARVPGRRKPRQAQLEVALARPSRGAGGEPATQR